MAKYLVTRDAARPDSDEHAGMAHVKIIESNDFYEARNAFVNYLIKEADWLWDFNWAANRVKEINKVANEVTNWSEHVFGEHPSKYEVRKWETDGLLWRLVRTEVD